MAASAASPSVKAAGPGCRISGDLISWSAPRCTAGTRSKPGRAIFGSRHAVGQVQRQPFGARRGTDQGAERADHVENLGDAALIEEIASSTEALPLG
jgi:hypothetical protein